MRKLPDDFRQWTLPERKMLIGYLWGLSFGNGNQVEWMKEQIGELYEHKVPLVMKEDVRVIQVWVSCTYGRKLN